MFEQLDTLGDVVSLCLEDASEREIRRSRITNGPNSGILRVSSRL